MYDLENPKVKDFVDNLERINVLGESTPGFVWRLKDEEGTGATRIQAYDDPRIIINFTIWESIKQLRDFTYNSDHADFFKRRREWFEEKDSNGYVLWWAEAGVIPSLTEAIDKLHYLDKKGPTPVAFTFKQNFPPNKGS